MRTSSRDGALPYDAEWRRYRRWSRAFWALWLGWLPFVAVTLLVSEAWFGPDAMPLSALLSYVAILLYVSFRTNASGARAVISAFSAGGGGVAIDS